MPRGIPGSLSPHGTMARYNHGKCRCADCSSARREYHNQVYGQKPLEEHLAAIEPAHGTEARYTSTRFHCRCAACREASRKAKARRRARAGVTS